MRLRVDRRDGGHVSDEDLQEAQRIVSEAYAEAQAWQLPTRSPTAEYGLAADPGDPEDPIRE